MDRFELLLNVIKDNHDYQKSDWDVRSSAPEIKLGEFFSESFFLVSVEFTRLHVFRNIDQLQVKVMLSRETVFKILDIPLEDCPLYVGYPDYPEVSGADPYPFEYTNQEYGVRLFRHFVAKYKLKNG